MPYGSVAPSFSHSGYSRAIAKSRLLFKLHRRLFE